MASRKPKTLLFLAIIAILAAIIWYVVRSYS
jgi:hypothetical protein